MAIIRSVVIMRELKHRHSRPCGPSIGGRHIGSRAAVGSIMPEIKRASRFSSAMSARAKADEGSAHKNKLALMGIEYSGNSTDVS